MKKLQNYLMKPEELRKKLDNPRFRQDFAQWSKSYTSINRDTQSRQSGSRSPAEKIQQSLQLQLKKTNANKENVRTQSGQKLGVPAKNASKTALAPKNTNAERNYHS